MALPAQALEKLTHVPEKTPGTYGQLLVLSASLFALAVFLYLGLTYGYEPYLAGQSVQLEEDIQNFAKQIPIEKQNEAAVFYSQLTNLKTVLSQREPTYPFWGWLEKNTLSGIYFSKITLNVFQNQAVMQGGAKSMDEISSQLAVFERAPEVSKVNFGNAALMAQGWQFSMTVFFKDKVFNQISSQ